MTTYYNNPMQMMTITCDNCGQKEDFYGDFRSCIQLSKFNNWQHRTINGKHYHFCKHRCEDKYFITNNDLIFRRSFY